MAFGVYPLFLSSAIAAFGGPESYFRLAIIAFGDIEFVKDGQSLHFPNVPSTQTCVPSTF